MMMTGRPGQRALTSASRSMPDRRACGCRSPAPAARRLQRGAARRGCWRSCAPATLARQRLLEHEADGLVVVNDPDGFHAAAARLRCRVGRFMASGSGIRLEVGPARNAVAFDRALVLLHEGLRQRAARAPMPPSRPDDQREEDAIADLGHARTVVLDMQFQCQAPALLADGDLARHARAQHDAGVAAPMRSGRAPGWRSARC
jgi:hypothetical protein